MDTSIDNLIKSISDSVKKKDEEIKNLETDLEICEDRIKKLKEEIKKLQADEPVDDYVKAAYNDGYGAAMGKMIAFLNKIKFDSAFNTKQGQGTLKKALAADYGKCYFKVYNYTPTRNKLDIVKALKDIYNVSVGEIKSYLASLPVNGYGNVVLLDKVSDTTCKKLREALRNVRIECDYFYI